MSLQSKGDVGFGFLSLFIQKIEYGSSEPNCIKNKF